jgi:competence protein ComEC
VWLRAPLIPVALAFGAGIALAGRVPSTRLWAIVLAALAAAVLALALRRPNVAAGLLLVGTVTVGALRAAPLPLPGDHLAHLALPASVTLTGRIEAEPTAFAPDRRRLDVAVESVDGVRRSGRLLITLYGEPPALGEGHRVRGEMRLHRASGFRNPGGFDYGRHLARGGILVLGSARADRLAVLDDPPPSWNVRLRRAARESIERALPPASAALLAGLLLGERAALPPEVDAGFRRAGVYHLLAVSGFNVALIAGATFALLSLVRFPRRVAAAAAIVVVAAFAAVVGPQPSVLRAAIMATLVLGALLVEREASVLNALALAAIVILALRPADLHDPGFQLSFAATAGIVMAPLPRGAVAGAVGVSLAAELAVLPITLAHFNQLTLIGPLANLGAVPLAGVATIVGLAGVTASWLSTAAGDVFVNATWPLLVVLRLLVAVAAAPSWALVHLPAPSWPAIACYVAALVLALGWWRWRSVRPRAARGAGALGATLLAVSVALGAWPLVRPPDGRLRVIVLDVGQGDAIIVEAPDGQRLLVDAGSGGPWRLDAGERVVAPVLWNRGALRLDAAVTTHDDQDHAGGMRTIRRLFRIQETWTAAQLRQATRVFGGIRLTAFADPRGLGAVAGSPGRSAKSADARRSRNDDALVLRIDDGLVSFLLASDITAATEARLLAALHPGALRATVLKVAHHGSRGSSTSEFLRAVTPLVAVISVGGRNAYGHPSPDTLARLDAVSAAVYRTDHDGAVILESDGRALTVTAWATHHTISYCLAPKTAC